jgi:predicted acylesterase/phospholipase RssA
VPKYKSVAIKNERDEAVKEAMKVIASPPGDAAQLLKLAERLSRVNEVGYARRVLLRANLTSLAIDAPLRLDVQKLLALSTYKDQELPPDDRLTDAEQMLRDLLAVIPDQRLELKQDTWGILGSVYKTRWTLFGSRDSLDRAQDAYLAGYKLGLNPDAGAHAGLNAAFVLDLLAGDASDVAAQARRAEAEKIRRDIIDVLTPVLAQNPNFKPDKWFYAKLGEAYLGTGQYDLARNCMAKVAGEELHNWEMETMARQFAHLSRLQALKEGRPAEELETSGAWSVVKTLLGGDATAALSFFRGKVGLALSGGGFRASLYHIGVLASLAERDMLRHVEVISCVSGGSILGMYLYLKLKKLLESKPDDQITLQDYVQLVHEIECEFLDGVQRNVRMRMLASPRSNWKVLFSRASSSTNRLGALYESELYARVAGPPAHFMDEVMVGPAGEDNFYPRYDNWRRKAKVPIIVLNSTTLNTCHNWQFTATFMGEPPQASIDAEIDANERLRRVYYSDAPDGYKHVRLGDAVAASSCVPGLFDPLVLDRLYQQGHVVRLVDGGLFDNQGVASLQEQDCSVMLVSDASGQTTVEKDPSGSRLSVSMRCNSVLMARIRQCEHQLLRSLCEAKVLRGMMYLHLKKDLEGTPVDWIACNDPSQAKPSATLTSYGIRRDVQRLLASVRTDLDSFADCEADALMLSGYRATDHDLPAAVTGFPLQPPMANPPWRFMAIAPIVEDPNPSEDLTNVKKLLEVAHSEAFKAFQLLPFAKPLMIAGGAFAISCFLALLVAYWNHRFGWYAWSIVFVGLAAAVGLSALEAFLVRVARYRNSPLQWLGSALVCLAGGPFLWFHLKIVDRYYLHWGPQYRKAGPLGAPPARAVSAAAGQSGESTRR